MCSATRTSKNTPTLHVILCRELKNIRADQTAHSRSLVCSFVVYVYNSIQSCVLGPMSIHVLQNVQSTAQLNQNINGIHK